MYLKSSQLYLSCPDTSHSIFLIFLAIFVHAYSTYVSKISPMGPLTWDGEESLLPSFRSTIPFHGHLRFIYNSICNMRGQNAVWPATCNTVFRLQIIHNASISCIDQLRWSLLYPPPLPISTKLSFEMKPQESSGRGVNQRTMWELENVPLEI